MTGTRTASTTCGMSAKPPSPRVARYVEEHRDEAVNYEPSWPLRRLLAVVVGVPALAIGAFYVYLIYAMSTCGCTPAPSYPPSPVEGVVVSVDAAGLGDVRSCQLRLTGGGIVMLRLGTLENATEFSPSHLSEHMVTSSPVRAYFRRDGGSWKLLARQAFRTS